MGGQRWDPHRQRRPPRAEDHTHAGAYLAQVAAITIIMAVIMIIMAVIIVIIRIII